MVYQCVWRLSHFCLALFAALSQFRLNSRDKPNKLKEGGFIHEDTFLYWG